MYLPKAVLNISYLGQFSDIDIDGGINVRLPVLRLSVEVKPPDELRE